MSRTGVILYSKPGFIIPSKYLEKAVEKNSTMMSATIFSRREDKVGELQIAVNTEEVALDIIEGAVEQFKDSHKLMYLGQSSEPYHEDDLQPYVLLKNKDGDPILITYLEGNFSEFHKAESSHMDEFFVANEYMIEKINSIWRDPAINGDIHKLVAKLQEPVIKRDFLNTSIGRGAIACMSAEGHVFHFQKNDLFREYEWGWVSNHFEYEDTNKETSSANPLAAAFGRKARPVRASTLKKEEPEKATAPSSPSATPPKAEDKPKPKPAETVSQETKETAGTEYVLVETSPPKELNGKKLKRWYRKTTGLLPENWEARPVVSVKRKKSEVEKGGGTYKAFSEIPKTAIAAPPEKKQPEQPKAATAVVAPEPVTKAKDTTPKFVSTSNKLEKPAIEDTKVNTEIGEFIKHHLDKNSQAMPDPKKVQSMEKEIPSFTKQFALDGLENTFTWQFEKLVEMGTKWPKALAMLCFELRETYKNQLAELDKLTEPAQTTEATNDKPMTSVPATGRPVRAARPVRPLRQAS